MKVQWTSHWQLRCTSCDETRPLARHGGMRITATSLHKYTVAWCRTCRRPRLISVEPMPQGEAAAAAAAEAVAESGDPAATGDRERKAEAKA